MFSVALSALPGRETSLGDSALLTEESRKREKKWGRRKEKEVKKRRGKSREKRENKEKEGEKGWMSY